MLLDEIITRLNASVPQLANKVAGSLEFQKYLKSDKLPPQAIAAFVFTLGFDAKPSRMTSGVHSQEITTRFSVALVVQSIDDPKGEKVRAKVESLVDEIIVALAGFAPGSCKGQVVQVMRGRLVDVTQGTAFYQIDFSINNHVRITR